MQLAKKKIKNINENILAKSIQKKSKTKTFAFNSFNKVKNFLDDEVKKDEIVIFMGAGNISELANNYVNNLGKVHV